MSRRHSPARATAGRRRAEPSRPQRGRAHLLLTLLVTLLLVGGAVAAVALVGGDDAEDAPSAASGSSTSAGTSGTSGSSEASAGAPDSSSAGTAAPTPRRPGVRQCYDLTYDEAVAAVSDVPASSCGTRHTARTYLVGDLPTLVDGHLVAVDSSRARRAPVRECPEQVGEFLGGDRDDLRLSMFRPVWFSPSVAESDRGASWYRCDVVVIAGDEELAPLTGRLEGVLGSVAGSRYQMCGTAEPGTARFERVVCARPHSWRAVDVVELADGDYPGVDSVRSAGQAPCEDVGRARAADPLSFRWGYEWPTRDQWRSGVTWGLCWVPDAS